MKKVEKNMIMVLICSFILLNLIGYFMNIDILKFSVKTENRHTTYFVSLYISLFISFVYYIIVKLLGKLKKLKVNINEERNIVIKYR